MEPLVTVLMLSYNHEQFIEKAIESVLKQNTSFDFELIIGDDYSSDKTRQVCLKYKRENPEILNLIFHDKNIGFQNNYIDNFRLAKGRYVAYLEGDDYWTDSNKLQKQFDFMEDHPDVAFCYTNAFSFYTGNEENKDIMIKSKPAENIYDLDFYIKNNCFVIPSLTLFIRKTVFPDPLPKWLSKTINFDWALNILLFQKGKAAYINEISAMYRIHKGGVISSTYLPAAVHNGIKLAKNLDKHFNYNYHHVFGKIQWRYNQLAVFYFEKKKYVKGFYWLFFCFFRNPIAFVTNTYFLKTLYKVTFTAHEV